MASTPPKKRTKLSHINAPTKQTSVVEWFKLGLPAKELRLAVSLLSGMTFRWFRVESEEAPYACLPDEACDIRRHDYLGVIGNVVVVLRETQDDVLCRGFGLQMKPVGWSKLRILLHHHFQYTVRREKSDNSETWGSDRFFASRLLHFPGVRVLRLDPWEAIVSFLGSANNNIKRNIGMISALAGRFPENFICNVGGRDFFSFPSLAQVGSLSEQELWELGWGYRAPRMVVMTQQVAEMGGEEWLSSVPALPYEDACARLMELKGVGRKVADCICLFSFAMHETVPIDTHAWQLVQRHYLPSLKSKSCSPKTYDLASGKLQHVFGQQAGWAFMVRVVQYSLHVSCVRNNVCVCGGGGR
jgi:N-glycosylase/DNA lyase